MRKIQRVLRTISVVTLFFFISTSIPLFQLAAYGAESRKPSGVSSKGATRTSEPRIQTTGDKFEKALDAIRENVAKAGDKADKGEDDAKELAAIKANKATIESADGEFRTEFAATEKKLKDAKLPKEILARHDSFVKQYDDNLKELKANLDDIDQAKTKSDRKAKIEKARLHLDKTKKPSMHQKLDPNNLPFQARKAGKTREPRLKKEEFEKDFPAPNKKKNTVTAEVSGSAQKVIASWHNRYEATAKQKPILVASNGSLDGLLADKQVPFSLGNNGDSDTEWFNRAVGGSFDALPYAINDSTLNSAISPQILAATTSTTAPSSDDLAETTEVQFTDDIKAKAAELGYNPVKIYEWVRNNINYQPYYGSLKGAQQTLAESSGNDFDQASLLIALLRVSQIEARYTYGTIEIPIEKVMNWVGGVSDPKVAGMILSSKGIPAKLLTSGGVIKKIQIEHVWVEAWIDYFPSWGARHKTGQGDTWIPLDPSFKQYTYNPGMDMYSLMGFNGDQFLQSYITDTRDITAYQDYGMKMLDFLDANYPDAEIEDILGASEIKLAKTIVKQEFPYLLGTLPYSVIVKAAQFSEAPDSKEYSVTIQIEGDPLTMTAGLNSLADKRITVSYDPATSSDESLVAYYGGNLYAVPPYLINVKPILRVGGAVVATGNSIGLGNTQNITISLNGPDGDAERIQNVITAGEYAAIILQPQETPVDTPSRNMATLIENSKKYDSPDITIDDLLGQILYSIGVSYFHTVSFESELFAKTLQLVNVRQPSEAMVTMGVNINYIFGMPRTISTGGFSLDVDRYGSTAYSSTQDKERERAFMILSGLSSSVSENRIFEAFFGGQAVSAIRLLKQASELGIPVYTLTGENINTILPQLQIDASVKTDIANAVNAGKNVIVSQSEMLFDEWMGVGYIAIDPASGAAGYMISGGLAGSYKKNPAKDPNFKATWLDKLLFDIARSSILAFAADQIGTLYRMGCKDPSVTGKCHNRIDCSGLTSLAYDKAGIPLINGKNAAQQYDFSLITTDPLWADLVFFKGSYDKNCDGLKDEADGITHVAVFVRSGLMIGAQKKQGVQFYEISSWTKKYPKYCEEFVCKHKTNSVCDEWDTCNCAVDWKDDQSQKEYDPFKGYGKILP